MGPGDPSTAPAGPGQRPPSSDSDPWFQLLPSDTGQSWPAVEDMPDLEVTVPSVRRPKPLAALSTSSSRALGPGDPRRTGRRRARGRLVRPYLISGGRTTSEHIGLEVEALVATTALGETRIRSLSCERRDIVILCRDVLSVAEVSAHLDIPLGVACVVVGDMANEGLVKLHRPASPDARPDLALLERVLYGLRDI